MDLGDGIYRVDGVSANVYVVVGDGITVVDTGMPGSGRKILRFLNGVLRVDAGDVDSIVISHQHIDHAGSSLLLRDATGAKTMVHEADADYLSGGRKPLRPRGAAGAAMALFSPFFRLRTFDPDVRLKERDTAGGMEVVHLPGHTPGSIALYDRGKEIAFTGDIVAMRGEHPSFPPHAFNDDEREMRASFGKLLSLAPATLLPGHGPPISAGTDLSSLLAGDGNKESPP